MKFIPIHKIVTNTNSNEYVDVNHNISNDERHKEIVIKVFGILVSKHVRHFSVTSEILNKVEEPLGFKKS